MSVSDEIAAAFADFEDDRRQEQRRRALSIISAIPSGTRDEDLTPEQRQAWRDYEDSGAELSGEGASPETRPSAPEQNTGREPQDG